MTTSKAIVEIPFKSGEGVENDRIFKIYESTSLYKAVLWRTNVENYERKKPISTTYYPKATYSLKKVLKAINKNKK